MVYIMGFNCIQYISVLENSGRELEDDATKCFHSSGGPFAINRLQALSEFLETDHSSLFFPTSPKNTECNHYSHKITDKHVGFPSEHTHTIPTTFP